jgi:hypothetical protein
MKRYSKSAQLATLTGKRTIFMKVINLLLLLVLASILNGCQGSIASQLIANSYPTKPRNYITAGFDNSYEIDDYAKNYEYFAFKISTDDWRSFYNRFPEYWKDIQKSKSYTFMNDYNAGYTAYAFRWNLINKKKEWDKETIERPKAKIVVEGDDIYKIVFALQTPKRILWDNDFDILIYNDTTSLSLEHGKLNNMMTCFTCLNKLSEDDKRIMGINEKGDVYRLGDDEVLKTMKLSRPDY